MLEPMFEYVGGLAESPLAQATCLIEQAFALIDSSPDSLAALLVIEGVSRRADRSTISRIATVERDGDVAAKGYRTTTLGLEDLIGWDHDTARRHVTVAQHVGPRTALDGAPLEPALPATAAAFTAGAATMRHVEVIAGLLNSRPATRISAADRISIEASLGEAARTFTPREGRIMGRQLLAAADLDGPEPADRPGRNTLNVHRNLDGTGSIHGEFDDPVAFDAIVTALDARTRPLRGEPRHHRGGAQRHGAGRGVPVRARPRWRRPCCRGTAAPGRHHRSRGPGAAGARRGTGHRRRPDPSQLRRIACDARVIPVVLGSRGKPLDVGRARRTVSLRLRRAVAARDCGCAQRPTSSARNG